MSEDENSTNWQEANGNKYPLGEFYKLIDACDLVRTNNKIVAFLLVSQGSSKAIRFYVWRKKAEDVWKVDLASMDSTKWNFDDCYRKISEWKSTM